jgi:glycosyltransferase involved in cell wall biosynthesis
LVLCSKLEIFEDVKETVHFLPGTDPNSIARGIVNLFNTPEIFNSKREIQQQWLKEHSWQRISDKLAGMIKALIKDSLNK